MKQNTFHLISEYRTEIMGFASLWIFFFHEWIPLLGGIPGLNVFELFIKIIGFLGVDIFFFLSGIGLVFSRTKNTLGVFYLHRFLRILPPYFAVGIVRMIYEGWSIKELILKLVGVDFYTVNIFSFLWFVPAIMTLYLLFPLYYYFFRKSESKGQFTISVLICWLLFSLIFSKYIRTDLFGFTNRIPVFLIGILFGWNIMNEQILFSKESRILCELALVLGVFLEYLTRIQGVYFVVPSSECCIPTLLMAISLSVLLTQVFSWNERHNGKGEKVVRVIRRFFSFFGKMSLEFYCVQELIGELVYYKWLPNLSPISCNILVFALSIISAIFLHKFTSGISIVIWKNLERTKEASTVVPR